MKKLIIILFLAINSSLLFAQILLTIEGTTVNNTEPGAWFGVNIQRSVPTTFVYRNNSITSINISGYMLQAGDEGTGSTNNNLDGEIITGNKFIWNGTDMTSITHGIFTGCNINAIIKYNYLYRVPMGIIRKSADNMTNTSGGVAYNIVTNPAVAIVVKGMSNVNIYNNTFYQTRTYAETGRGLIDVYTNTDISPNSFSHGTKIKNNIFYTKYQTINIRILDNDSFTDLECDYNLYWCEAGTPKFEVNGSIITFAQWQALGYDTHSKVINPNFTNSTDLVPGARLDYGVNLGTTWQTGLSTTAVWNVGSSPATTNQNGTWQVGARIYDAGSINLSYISSVVENATPTLLEMTYNLSLANIAPAPSAFRVQVNSVDRIVNSVAIVAAKVRLTLASAVVYGDNVTVAYTKPASNQLQSAAGAQAASITAQPVLNNCINLSPVVIITSPGNNSIFKAPATITITANASDTDGTVSLVEFFSGSTKLGEIVTSPYTFIWNNIPVGNYSLTAVATDNFNAKTTSSAISISVNDGTPPLNKPPVVSITSPAKGSTFTAPANIIISANASDSDGTISKVEFFNGALKLGEINLAPYLYSWTNVNTGTYVLTVIATDNSNATTSSSSVEVHVVSKEANAEIINLFPNPNSGVFKIEILNSLDSENNHISIINMTGEKVYEEILPVKESTRQFNLNFLDSGIYILMISGEKVLTVKKFIKI